MRYTLFISDLHLTAKRPDITAWFTHFLKEKTPQADALYILGDFFEFWIGDDACTPYEHSIMTLLRKYTQNGLPIYLLQGNRDFLLGTHFMKATGCTLLPDPICISLYGRDILLSHGDRFCTDDKSHQRFRYFTQRATLQALFLRLPIHMRKKIAEFLRKSSQRHTDQLAYRQRFKMDVTHSTVEMVMKKYQVTQLIHGHTHQAAFHKFTLLDQISTRMVLPDWHERAGALFYFENGDASLWHREDA